MTCDGVVVMTELIIDTSMYFLWVGDAKVDHGGMSLRTAFRERMPASVHIISKKGSESLCGMFTEVKLPPHGGQCLTWSVKSTARSMVTSVKRKGSASARTQSNITFMRLCKECFAKAQQVRLRLSVGLDKNNGWNSEHTVLLRNTEEDLRMLEEWRERGLYV